MASSSSPPITLGPLQLLRTYGTSSSRVGLRVLRRPSPPSVRLQPAKGRLRPVAAAASYRDEASGYAGAGEDGVAAATTSVALQYQVDDAAAEAERRAAARTVGRGPQPPKGRPGKPKEGGGGKVHAVLTTSAAAKRVPGAPAPLGLPKDSGGASATNQGGPAMLILS